MEFPLLDTSGVALTDTDGAALLEVLSYSEGAFGRYRPFILQRGYYQDGFVESAVVVVPLRTLMGVGV